MKRNLAYLTALAILILSGIAQGVWTDRWKMSRELEAAVAKLNGVPTTIGEWSSRSSSVEQEVLARAGVDGYISRRYENRRDGSNIRVFLVCGRPGPIAVHTPDYCYVGAGYTALAPPLTEPVRPEPPALPAEFKTATFRKESAVAPSTLRIFWSWNAAGVWKAPDNPRLQFAPYRALYKLYVIRDISSTDGQVEDETCKRFIHQFLPELGQALFPTAAQRGASGPL